jgi:hypothetical protein
MDTEEKVAKVVALTEQLGAVTADEIAQRIRESEVGKGEQGSAKGCPLALLFTKVVGFEVWVTAARWSIPVYGSDPFLSEEIVMAWEAEGEMPNSCVTFINSIDAGYGPYADLVEHMDYEGDDEDDDEPIGWVDEPFRMPDGYE